MSIQSQIKNGVRAIDRRLLNDRVFRNYAAACERRDAKPALTDPHFDYRYEVRYHHRAPSMLAALCDRYGSDKGSRLEDGVRPYPWPAHTYADFYSQLFDHCRQHVRRVFECGLGTNNPELLSTMTATGKPGASLRAWRDYFPHAEIVGADIDRAILFQEDRIRTYYVDQTDPAAIAALWASAGGDRFDLMIDDGLHTFDAGRCLFEHAIDRLAPGGLYVIEDVNLTDLARFQAYFAGTRYDVRSVLLSRPGLRIADNVLVTVRAPLVV